MAALVGAPLCEKNKKIAKQTNFISIKNLIKECKKNQKIIYPTTNSGYGIGEKNKFCDENTPLKPISLYGITKVMAEDEIMKYKKSVSLRLATVFGASYRMRSDLMVNNFVEKALTKKKFNLYSNQYATRDGTCIRDYIHLEDLSKIHCKLLKIIANNNKSYLFNCGYGFGYSVMEIIRTYEKIYKLKFKKIFKPRRKGDIVKIFSNTNRLDRILKLQLNKKNKLQQIIKSSVLWENFLNGK
jgi:UDP-glucose 4-epimerase